jgi:hypothetical protein
MRKNALYLHSRLRNNGNSQSAVWGISSVGSERLPYKQDVGGSNPSFPTKALQKCKAFFCFRTFSVDIL